LGRSAPPRFAVPATDRPSYGPALVATAATLGWDLMDWQLLVAHRALEHDPSGRLTYRDVVISTPRQVGKSSLILALIVWRMLSARQTIVYGAQTRLAARRRLFDVWWPRLRRSALGELFSLDRATGAEALRARNGSILTLLSTDEGAAHGEVLDLAVLDECWSLDAAAEQACRPAMSTRHAGQLWLASTAGTERSTFWRDKVDQGRTQATLGLTEGLFYAEWSAADDVDVADPATWAGFHPALEITIEADTLAKDLAGMPLAEWRRAYANQWSGDLATEGWRVISRELWEETAL
jgi:phage terminase large subunit-like protein